MKIPQIPSPIALGLDIVLVFSFFAFMPTKTK